MKHIIGILLICIFQISASESLLLRQTFDDSNHYTANNFSDGSSDYFTHWNNALKMNSTFINADGANYFVAEDVDAPENPLGQGESAYLRLDGVNVHGYDSVKVIIALAATNGENPSDPIYRRNQFESEDSMMLEYAFDGDSAAAGVANLPNGNYSVLTAFRGYHNVETQIYSTSFTEDADNDGNRDPSGLELSDTFQDVSYTIAATGTIFSFRLRIDVDGLDDVGFDNIRIIGLRNATPVVEINNGASLNENDSVIIDSTLLSVSDEDTENSSLLFQVTTAALHGKLYEIGGNGSSLSSFTYGDILNGKICYQHDGSESLDDVFAFSVSDGEQILSDQSFAITVNPVNDAPVLTDVAKQTIAEDSLLIFDVSTMCTADDPENDSLTVSILNLNDSTVTISGDTIRPVPDFNGELHFQIRLYDASDSSETDTLVLDVLPVPDTVVTTDSRHRFSRPDTVDRIETLVLPLEDTLKTTYILESTADSLFESTDSSTEAGSFYSNVDIIVTYSYDTLETLRDTLHYLTLNIDSSGNTGFDTVTVVDSLYSVRSDTLVSTVSTEIKMDSLFIRTDSLAGGVSYGVHIDTTADTSSMELSRTEDTLHYQGTLCESVDTTHIVVSDTISAADSIYSDKSDTIITVIRSEDSIDSCFIRTDSLENGVSFWFTVDTSVSNNARVIDTTVDTLKYQATLTEQIDTIHSTNTDTVSAVDSVILINSDTVITTIRTENWIDSVFIRTDSLSDGVSFWSHIYMSVNSGSTVIDTVTDTLSTAVAILDKKVKAKPVALSENPVDLQSGNVRFHLPAGFGTYRIAVMDALGNKLFERSGSLDEESVSWDLTNRNRIPVTSGSYLVMMKTGSNGTVEYYRSLLGVRR